MNFVRMLGEWGLWVALALSAAAASKAVAALPDPPLLKRDVHLVDRGQLTRPAIPATRVTNDGRVSVDFSSVTQVEFTLLKPEALDEPFDKSPPGYTIIGGSDIAPFNVNRDLFHNSRHNGFGDASHHTICEGTSNRYPSSSTSLPVYGTSNPYPCADDEKADCYDLTMISTTMTRRNSVELWGTPFTVKVVSPKTRWARIESVDVGTPKRGPTHGGIASWFEPLTSGDGRLLIGRTGFSNMFYSVMDEEDTPCDVAEWTERHEITRAHHDHRMWEDGTLNGTARYGFAQYPMKDGAGNLIPKGAASKLTYPWMDKAGDNIFFTSVASTLFYKTGGTFSSRYPVECYSPGCYAAPVNNNLQSVDTTPPLRGIGVFGSWTHGKVLLVDNLNNNIDYGTGWGDNQQYNLTLYSGSSADSKVRIGGAGFVTRGKFLGPGGLPRASTYPYVYIIDSVENLFNDIPAMVPSTIRDVAWYVNLGKGTDKVIFDEWLNPDVLIYSEWIPTLVHTDTSSNRPNGYMHYRDGFTGVGGGETSGTGFNEPIWFQNDATALKYKVAPYGLATQGKNADELIRAEPVAQGGVHGRGLWLFDYNNVTYAVPQQNLGVDIGDAWYVGLYVDHASNSSDTTERRLLTFPDGSFVELKGSKVRLFASGGTAAVKEFELNSTKPVHPQYVSEVKRFVGLSPIARRWKHLGFQVLDGGAKVEFLVDGFKKGVWDADDGDDTRMFRMSEGDFVLGSPSSDVRGFRGWTDSLLVVAQNVNPEVACNYANGTLVGTNSSDTYLNLSTDYYPDLSHADISSFLTSYGKTAYSGYFCLHDYSTDLDIDTRDLPSGVAAIREDMIFPQGPLAVGSARPDTRTNEFCLSCHTESSKTPELKVGVLASVSQSVENDERRQPGQGQRLLRGNLPTHHLGLDWTPSDLSLPKGRALVSDLFTLDSNVARVDPRGDADFDGVANSDDPFPNDINRTSDLDGDRIDDLSDDDLDGAACSTAWTHSRTTAGSGRTRMATAPATTGMWTPMVTALWTPSKPLLMLQPPA